MHAECQRGCQEEQTDLGNTDHEVLEVEFAEQNDQEPPVAGDALEDVQARIILVSDFATVYHVEQVHQDESLEEQGKMLQAVSWVDFAIRQFHVERLVLNQFVLDTEHHRAQVQQNQHDDSLVQHL